ncbi:hypothetical protein QBC35DRAFT_524518 [Podospora australis]|uniref:Rik1-associated factor 1 n=1 Tax=Podospora australis TaxID=1536484 RepID=A0AAN7AG92_9PEZI|nr:hypothetical protein QBC35DRAFT_524518 [Podospora australis]
MSSTVTATASTPRPTFQHSEAAINTPGTAATPITSANASRPPILTASSPYSNQEPRPKRRRVEGPEQQPSSASVQFQRLHACLKKQVLPYLAQCPPALHSQVLGQLTKSPEFLTEFTKGHGELSREYEATLAAQIRRRTQTLMTSQWPSAGNALTTPKHPTPSIPVVNNASQPFQNVVSTTRYSSSPIPIPVVPSVPKPARATTSTTASLLSTAKLPAPVPVMPAISTSPIPLPAYTRALPSGGARPAPAIAATPRTDPPPSREATAPVVKDRYGSPATTSAINGNPAQVTIVRLPLASDSTIDDRPEPPEIAKASPPIVPAAINTTPVNLIPKATPSISTPKDTHKKPKPAEVRPYIDFKDRAFAVLGTQHFLVEAGSGSRSVIHVDFALSEIEALQALVLKTLGLGPEALSKKKGARGGLKRDLGRLLRKNQKSLDKVLDACEGEFAGRRRSDMRNFIQDLMTKNTTSRDSAVLTLLEDPEDRQGQFRRETKVSSLLLGREIVGNRGFSLMRRPQNFNNEFRKCREDDLELKATWTGGAGDIITIAWVSNDGYICGTTEHSDAHNQQYNKPGNLLLGSCSAATLRSYPQHRIVRPIVERGENSTNAMRESQDPWLYSSVVASDYDCMYDRAYTAGFDRSVKIWRVKPTGQSMSLLGDWEHEGNVNFVAVSKHPSGLVATAADVATEAVRVYLVNEKDIKNSRFRPHSCSRVTDDAGNLVSTEKWAYYPATMQWGCAPEVQTLLLVGYSPRSRTGDDSDIPEERRNSGELCLWDGMTGERWRVLSAASSNVFEVLWHPTQPCFIAATAPFGLEVDARARTQIRVFCRPADEKTYGDKVFNAIKVLDCDALDINELTIMPNSATYCYVTAGCTDGKVYVWDTARGDRPIHVLKHGEPIDEYRGDREREDVGVKFTAWGSTLDRFYTGSSDGLVKVWNIRSDKPLIRVLFEAPAPVSCGMFSPDKSRLILGDASGRVFMLSVNEEELPAGPAPVQANGLRRGTTKIIRPPRQVIPHPEPAPPRHDAEGRPLKLETAGTMGHSYLASGQLKRHPNPTIGVVQGENYAQTGLFNKEAHFNNDPTAPLIASIAVKQRDAGVDTSSSGRSRRRQYATVKEFREIPELQQRHMQNLGRDLNLDALPEETKQSLRAEGVDFALMGEYVIPHEEEEEPPLLKGFNEDIEVVEVLE